MFRFGLHMCGDAEDARDVLQDTLLAAARNIGDFRGDASISTWLYTIARSFCVKKRRRSKFAPAEQISLDGAAGELVSPAPGPEELAARDEIKQAPGRRARGAGRAACVRSLSFATSRG